ncbi:MAG TPA: DUF3027 domain-containing protein [Actinomycetes bacterium]|nr:DUF3027 domain-containing protein [Actinomycetes bacterium]
MNTLSGRRPAVDSVCADAVDQARAALDGLAAPESVGEHLGVEADDERVVTHLFDASLPGYRGWRWAVTVARASRGRTVTVDDAVLLPGPDALLPPEWIPWTERLRPGDLGVGDLLPTDEDDERLEPGWNATSVADTVDGTAAEIDDDELTFAELVAALDLTRPRVLSPIGLDDAFDRWQAGDHGPDAPMALSAPATCASCGFRLPIRGQVGQAFGVCANAIAPSDGHVVALNYGCGAHSEAVVIPALSTATAPFIDEVGYDIVIKDDHAPGTVLDEDPGEELGHG